MIYGNGVLAKIGKQSGFFEKSNIIFNAAGCPHPNEVTETSISREHKHIENLCRRHNSKWLIHCSTPAVLGFGDSFHENDDYRKHVTEYGLLKRDSEIKLMNDFPNLTILRIFSLTSIFQEKQIVWDAFTKMKKPFASFSISKAQNRDFVHQSDLQRYLEVIIQNEIKGIVNITNTRSTSLRDLILEFSNLIKSCSVVFEDNFEKSNYLNLSCNDSKIFNIGILPIFQGIDAPIDIFKKLINE